MAKLNDSHGVCTLTSNFMSELILQHSRNSFTRSVVKVFLSSTNLSGLFLVCLFG